VAAAGGHNVLMSGAPGAGKTLLARSLPSILLALTLSETLDVTRIYWIDLQCRHTCTGGCAAAHIAEVIHRHGRLSRQE
jgi:predicted ATPase with chaperone activity